MRIVPRMPTDLLPIGEAARRLGKSIDTLRRWDATGRLPAVRLNGVRFYRAADVDAILHDAQATA